MIFLQSLKCPKCKGNYNPDYEDSLRLYVELYASNISLEAITSNTPFKRPDFLVFKCDNPDCGVSKQHTELEILNMLKEQWSDAAWNMAKTMHSKMQSFDGHFTKYILEKDLGKFITEDELDSNPILREYMLKTKNG